MTTTSRQSYNYDVPVQADSPWPTFRRDRRNTGSSPIVAHYHGDQPWFFQTGKGIFSTPVIDGQGTIYIGSADHHFYAINSDGTAKWRFRTGEVIDSAGALLADGTIVFPSGDGYLYRVQTADGSPVWRFDARVAARASYNNWWEGNVAVGFDGTLYAGNTNFNYYAINPDGSLKWAYPTGSNAWSIAALSDDGTIFWGSCDTFVRAVRPDGAEKWRRRTLGLIAASAVLGSDGTVYIGSFDSTFYALDPHTGRVKWKYRSGDHIYASAALGEDEQGQTTAIYFGSSDGIFYALNPDGELLWTYDTGAPIRSSPALGCAPEGGRIVYFGCGNGRLYALNAADGSRRWSFDTTPDDPVLSDRNDLNGSPALGETGIVIGGEHGQVWYVPYDYPLHVSDRRSSIDHSEDLPTDMSGMLYVTPGGNLKSEALYPLPAASIITLRLVIRKGGKTINARLYNAPIGRPRNALRIRTEPEFPLTAEVSADGRYIHIIPTGFLETGRTYSIWLEGGYYTGGLRIGNLTLGGRRSGRFESSFTFRVAEATTDSIPLAIGDKAVTALEWTRLAVPIPTMLPSLNQIGFDYMDWILGTVALSEPDPTGQGRVILWAIGGKRNEKGVLIADPESDFRLPLSGVYRRDSFILSNHHFTMQITGIPIPFRILQLRGQLGADLRLRPGATGYAEAKVLSIPTFGPLLVLAGLATNWWQKLLALHTYITQPYDMDGPANKRPPGIVDVQVNYEAPSRWRDGKVTAQFRLEPGAEYPLSEHRPSILLIDPSKIEVVQLNYHAGSGAAADQAGNLSTAWLRIPAGTKLPTEMEAIVIVDVFPLHRQRLK